MYINLRECQWGNPKYQNDTISTIGEALIKAQPSETVSQNWVVLDYKETVAVDDKVQRGELKKVIKLLSTSLQ